MREIIIFIAVILLANNSMAQDCDSTKLFKEAITKSINYNDSLTKIADILSPGKGIVGNDIYIGFFYESAKYLPNKIGKYTIHKISSKYIEKIYKENYKRARINSNMDYAQYEIGGGLQHIDKNRINIYISLSRKITVIEDDTLGIFHEITNSYFMQESTFTYKFDCNKKIFVLETENHQRSGSLIYDSKRYKQEGKSLYKESLEHFLITLSENKKNIDTINIGIGYSLYEPDIVNNVDYIVKGVHIKLLSNEMTQHFYTNRIPFKFIESVIWECNGQLVYTIYFKKHKKAFLQKNVVEKFLYSGNYYYQFNCETGKWELVKTEFVKPNKRVKWK